MYAKPILNKNRKQITLVILFIVAILFNAIVIDRYILPSQRISDKIVKEIRVTQTRSTKFGRSTSLRGYKYYTENGFEFLTDKESISDITITVEKTLIFKNIVSVSTEGGDKKELLTGLGGINAYFYLILALSSTISICYLKFKSELSDNEFLNIILFNGFIIFVLTIIWTLV